MDCQRLRSSGHKRLIRYLDVVRCAHGVLLCLNRLVIFIFWQPEKATVYGDVCLGFFQFLPTKICCGLSNASAFQLVSIKIVLIKTIQNQHEHIIGWVVTTVIIRCFLDREPFRPLHLPPHVILWYLDSSHSQILRKAGKKKLNQTGHKSPFSKALAPLKTHLALAPITHWLL